MWKRCLALTLTLAMVLLAAPASAVTLAPSATLETAPLIAPSSYNQFTTPRGSFQYYKLELHHAGVIVLSLEVFNRDTCPYFNVELRALDTGKLMTSAITGYQSVENSPWGAPVSLFTAEVPAGSYYLKMFMDSGVNVAVVSKFTCPHSNYSYTTETEAATCAQAGYTKKICGNCGEEYDKIIYTALPHTLSPDGWTVTKEPTCIALGSESQICRVCRQTATRSISSLGHVFGEGTVTVPATCTSKGQKAYPCLRCGATNLVSIPKLDHPYSDWVSITAPTCTGSGKQVRVCAACGAEETGYLPPTGHTYGEWAVTREPTCTDAGVEAQTCLNCDSSKTRSVTKLGHSYGDWAVTTPPTCTADGVESMQCRRCDAANTRSLPRTGHTYGPWEVYEAPTCFQFGTERRICAGCGCFSSRELGMVHHRYTTWEYSGLSYDQHGEACSSCDFGCGASIQRDLPLLQPYMAPIGPNHRVWWSCSPEGLMNVTSNHYGTFILLAACYDDRGNFLEVKPITVDKHTQLTGCLENARLFFLNEDLIPQDVSQVIFDHPTPWPDL